MSDVTTATLNTGAAMPRLGFGVFQVPPDDVQDVVRDALDAGYRSIDTATLYRNESGVGKALAESGIDRDDLFVTTKLDLPIHGRDAAIRAFDESLELLGLDYVDLYLIHWPQPAKDRYVDTWRGLEQIASGGRAKAIGVSNFNPAHLLRLFDETDVVPAVNQVELHPYLTQDDLRALHAEHGIVTEAWSPLAHGGDVLADPVVTGIADKYDHTPAQVVIRWHLQIGNVTIPKSVRPQRIRENLAVFDFELDDDEVRAISELNRDARIGPNPDDFNP